MAYRRRSSSGVRRRSTRGGYTRRRTASYSRPGVRRAASRQRSGRGGQHTVRIVVEQGAATPHRGVPGMERFQVPDTSVPRRSTL